MAKWFPRAVGSISHGHGSVNNSLPPPYPGSILDTTKRWSTKETGVHRMSAYIRGRDLDAPDVTLNKLLIIAPGF